MRTIPTFTDTTAVLSSYVNPQVASRQFNEKFKNKRIRVNEFKSLIYTFYKLNEEFFYRINPILLRHIEAQVVLGVVKCKFRLSRKGAVFKLFIEHDPSFYFSTDNALSVYGGSEAYKFANYFDIAIVCQNDLAFLLSW